MDDARPIEVPVSLLLHVTFRARVVKVDRSLPMVGYICCGSHVDFVGAENSVVEEKQNEEFVNDAVVRVCGVAGVGVIQMEENGDAIGMKLALLAVVLRWTETNEGAIESPNGNATIAPVEQR